MLVLIGRFLLGGLIVNATESFIDNVVFEKVEPKVGSIIYADFICSLSTIQHSGIYVGNGEVVHLRGTGLVEKTSLDNFVRESLGTIKSLGMTIYVSCDGSEAVGLEIIADHALRQVGMFYDYNITKFNCHQFVAGCLRGWIDPQESLDNYRFSSSLTSLKLLCREVIGSNNWRALED